MVANRQPDDLIELANLVRGELDLYVFGSFLRKCENPQDIDILVIYRDLEALRIFKQRISPVIFGLPVHLIAMTPAEERHYEFIATTDAHRIGCSRSD
jgi:predicted nucleotidyltransferase